MTTGNEPGATTCKVVAPSSLKALRLLREQLGPDAFVLSSRVTDDGVEMIASLEEPVAAVPTPAPQLIHPVLAAPALLPLPAPAFRGEADSGSVLREIHSMRGMIEEQLAGLAWNKSQSRDPLRGQLLRTLLGAGFSARLAKGLLADLPDGLDRASGLAYIKSAMGRQIPLLENEDALMNEGGVWALMGPTGVGKTTTTAKLAARCVMRFGPEKLALVTTDTYRIGAYEQLRIYGQILGVSVHAVKDAVDLELVLADLRDKHMVLIDTVGMSQRDRAVSEQISMLCGASRPVKRLLLLNASSHGDTLNEVVQAYRHSDKSAKGSDLAGCILTKVDEATHPGVLIDTVIRHQLPIHYISSGQKVPEHLMLCNRNELIDSVFSAKSRSSLFVPGEADIDEQPAALRHEESAAAAAAVSDRLRSQCQQLIRVLSHNAQELTSNAAALADGDIGFDENRSLWRQLSDDDSQPATMAREQLSRASADSQRLCNAYILASSSEISLETEKTADSRVLVTTMLSDRSGLPFAASRQFLAGDEKVEKCLGSLQQQGFDKPIVHLLDRLPSPESLQAWQSTDLQWVTSVPSDSKIFTMLGKLIAGLSFSVPQAATVRGKTALLSVAEVWVNLSAENQHASTDASANASMLHCVVRRVIDAATGKPLMHNYVLASANLKASAQQIVQWAAWRAATEPYFKLLEQGLSQFRDGPASAEIELPKRLLVAAQTCVTVFLLQQKQAAWAESARRVLAQLTGRPLRPDRPVSAPALLDGLEKLFVLLDALETDEAIESSLPDLASARK
ncbi:MAG: flagellar biosynthesis protein FlhF [Polaromonas sp.]